MQKQARRSALLHSGDHDGKWTHGKTAFVLCLPLYALENGYQHLLDRSDARGGCRASPAMPPLPGWTGGNVIPCPLSPRCFPDGVSRVDSPPLRIWKPCRAARARQPDETIISPALSSRKTASRRLGYRAWINSAAASVTTPATDSGRV